MADCTYSVPNKDISGDNWYGPQICNQELVDWFWDSYNFNYDYWQDGWGWDDCCNTDKPLARTFSGLMALNYSTTDPLDEDYGHDNMLYWGGRYAREMMSDYDLRALCGGKVATTFGAGCTSYRENVIWDCTEYRDNGYKACRGWHWLFAWICWGWFWVSSLVCIAWGWVSSWFCAAGNEVITDKRIELYNTAYFYDQAVPERASTFVHECRHIDGKAHVATFPSWSSYGAGNDGADPNWDYQGAWTWEVAWLSWYYATAVNSTDALRVHAKDEANDYINNAFATHPGFNIT